MQDEMKKAIFRKYRDYKFQFETWEELKQATGIKDTDIIKCEYCKTNLEPFGKPPHYNTVVTLDRKIPKFLGGKNTIENTCFSCKRCNTDKGILTYDQYKEDLEKRKKMLWEFV